MKDCKHAVRAGSYYDYDPWNDCRLTGQMCVIDAWGDMECSEYEVKDEQVGKQTTQGRG